jgi:hypothetical protein
MGQLRGDDMTTRRWVDWVNVILGVWLIASSGLLTLAAGQAAAWSACSAGIALVILAGLAMTRSAVWLDALGVMVGAWLMLSPWAIYFVSSSSAATNAFIVGVLVIAYALWAMRLDIATSTNARTTVRAMRSVRR